MQQYNERNGTQTQSLYLAGSLVALREQALGTGVVTVKYQHTDALGSPVAVTDATGAVIERSEYEPYGYLLNRPLKDGPGYTGHVSDAATGLSYMQQRYMDPKIGGRFLSVDPVAADNVGGNFNRYWYANNNPYKFRDLDGREAKLTWLAPNQVELLVTYRVNSAQATPATATADMESRFASDFSGTVEVNGQQVQVTASAIQDANAATEITVVPTTVGVTQSNREETNAIGGNLVTIGAATGAGVVSHEFGHVAGAGDQYLGGVAANGSTVTTAGPGNNAMQDLGGAANSQSLREIITAPTNTNTCEPGVEAVSGGC
ncbi:hypothetical protein FCE95_09445 [Luteimonas gilva]|uniref:Teneurin-like YD-shell domain-containing protein n=2 Tax=Luteimonas gilva TaxID=2572684 RepID=A0A4U5JRJ4_9GAMM|nr:hypothetical protein FCE95_09445 [Luteimonas gilva]